MTRRESEFVNSTMPKQRDFEKDFAELQERYDFVVRAMAEAFGRCEIIYDDQGRPIDWKYIEANQGVARCYQVDSVVGRRASEFIGDVRKNAGNVLSLFSRVSQSGRPESFTGYVGGLNRWLYIRAARSRTGEVIEVCEDWTARRRVDELLSNNSERVALVQDTASAGYWDWDVHQNKIRWTDQMYELFGIKRDESVDLMQAWIDRVHPEDRDSAITKMQEAIRGQQNLFNEYRIVRPDGKPAWIAVLGRGTYDEGGKNTYLTGICIDVTARKAMETELSIARTELEEDYRNFDRLRSLVRKLSLNADMQSLLEEVLSASISLMNTRIGFIFRVDESADIMRVSMQTEPVTMAHRMIRRGEYASGRAWAERKQIVVENMWSDPAFANLLDSTDIRKDDWQSVVATPLISHENRVLGVISIYFKGTGHARERNLHLLELYARYAADAIEFVEYRNSLNKQDGKLKETLRLTQETKSQLEAVIEAIQDGICVLDRDSKIVFANQAMVRMGGVSTVDELRQKLGDLSKNIELKEAPAFSRISEWPVARIFRGESIRELQFEARRISGDQEWLFQCSGEPVRNERGEVILAVVVIRDVTEKKQTEVLRATIESRDEFLSMASHELKTPLTSLHVALQLIQRMIEKPEPQDADYLNRLTARALESSSRLGRLVNELLDLTRIRVGKMQLEKHRVNLGDCVRTVLSQMQEDIVRARSEIRIELDQRAEGEWDRSRIEQVVSNLISNALKYGEGQPIEIQTQLTQDARKVLLTVRDYGLGIPSDMQSRIFQRFDRAGMSERILGLGLGLYIVRQIVEAHGGRVWVDSVPKKGSVFFVELPANAEGVMT